MSKLKKGNASANKQATQILYRLKLEGNGIVNYDESSQSFIFSKLGDEKTNHMRSNNANNRYGKKRFYMNEDGSLRYHTVISAHALRHAIFKNDLVAQSANVLHNEAVLNSYLASIQGILRGYTFATKKNDIFKRTSTFGISEATEVSNAMSTMEIGVRSGWKNTDKNKETADPSMYNNEVIGDTKYTSRGHINLEDISFIPADSAMDRLSFNPDKYEGFYKPFIKSNIPNFGGETGFYTLASSSVVDPEFGLRLPNDNIVFLVKELISRLMKLEIRRATAYARVSKMEIKIVYDPLVDTIEDESGWVTMNNDTLEQLNFDTKEFYSKMDESNALSIKEAAMEDYNANQALIKAESAKKKEKRAADKDAKNAAKLETSNS